ncbi:flagellar protein FlgN [Paenibacillus sp. Soil787]|uniref:flagellar protein FlgN n=1 Tax=Paenibacillus sp. Soil787 TaxID=1736411 RepID=UPI0006F8A94C|nr:flagellar protein FlgN [Paenibacillus sp. Soil787]KRF33992.1 hypothetical protein ASG93_26715 [Paenibacillus sp. Soil787]
MSISVIVETMEELISLHDALLETSKEKTPVLVDNRVDRLNKIVLKESKLIKRIEEINQLRIQLIGEYLLSRGYRPDPRVKVSDLIKVIFKAEEKKSLTDIHERLSNKIKELKQVNELNQNLIEHSLSFIDYSINLLMNTPEQDAVYSNPHQQYYASARSGWFDTKA